MRKAKYVVQVYDGMGNLVFRDIYDELSQAKAICDWYQNRGFQVFLGLAKFGEILRDNNDNMKKFSYNIIKNLVKYVDVAQGAFFIINDENEKEIYYDLYATIAFGRRNSGIP